MQLQRVEILKGHKEEKSGPHIFCTIFYNHILALWDKQTEIVIVIYWKSFPELLAASNGSSNKLCELFINKTGILNYILTD